MPNGLKNLSGLLQGHKNLLHDQKVAQQDQKVSVLDLSVQPRELSVFVQELASPPAFAPNGRSLVSVLVALSDQIASVMLDQRRIAARFRRELTDIRSDSSA